MGRKHQKWGPGDVFLIPLKDGSSVVAQVLDMMMPNVASCAIFDIRITPTAPPPKVDLDTHKLISKIATARHHFDAGAWKVIGHQKPSLPQRKWPNEQFRRRGWIGAEHYTGA